MRGSAAAASVNERGDDDDALPECTLSVLDTDHLGALAATREPVLADLR